MSSPAFRRRIFRDNGTAEPLALVGNPDGARREATLAAALMPPSRDAVLTCVIGYNAAAALALVGDHAAALEMLEQTLALGHRVSGIQASLDPRFDALRDDPRFQNLIRQQ